MQGSVPISSVEDKVIVELKSVEDLAPVHKKQLLTYLRLSGLRLGLLINSNVELIKDGIVRIVNKLDRMVHSLCVLLCELCAFARDSLRAWR
jgi:uncharacterized membrane protein